MLFNKKITIVLLLFLSLLIALLILFINLPDILESQIKNRIKTGIGKNASAVLDSDDIEFNIQNFGFFNTNISNIKICESILVDSINIDYKIKNLSSINVEKVTISGLNIHALLDENNQIKLKGLNLPERSKDESKNQDLTFLQYLPGKIVIENSKIILHYPDKQSENDFMIPFEIVSSINIDEGTIDTNIKFYPFGESINSLVAYDINNGVKSVQIQGRLFDIAHLNRFISKKSDKLRLKGQFDFTFESDSPQKKWNLDISNIALVEPLRANLEDLKVNLSIDNKKIKTAGFMYVSSPLLQTIGLEYTAGIDLQNKNYFDLKLKTLKINTLNFLHESNIVTVKQPVLSASFNGIPENIKGAIYLNIENINVQNNKADIAVDDVKIVSNLIVQSGKKGINITSDFKVHTKNIDIHSNFMESEFPTANIIGKFLLDNKNSPSCDMLIKIDDAKILSSKLKTKVSGINIELPVYYPQSSKKPYGKYSISSILYDKKYDFFIKGEILPITFNRAENKFNYKFKILGDAGFNLLPQIKTQFDSIIGFDDIGLQASLEVKTNSFKFNESDLKKLFLQKNVSQDFSFNISLNSKVDFSGNKLQSSMSLDVNDGQIVLPDNNLTVKGINTQVRFDDLLALTTVPGQVVTIDLIEKEKIKIDNAKIIFTIEKGKSLLIENVKFKWCNGLVSTEAIRFPQANNEYSLSLYCDRLEMTQLLKQVGDFNAQGSGTLNGRIPVLYSKGNISFENGFLFSTPGKGGKILIENSNKIIAGIPLDSPQFAQLDLAQEALQDFKYKWAKLKFHTNKETLFVNMELDGEPSKVLPFKYSREFGGFVRVDTSSPGSHFQGIKLDINLQLPFNEVLKSGNKLKSIFN